MKKLDIYIIKKFLGTFVFSILLFTAIAIVIDITEKIDDMIEKSIPLEPILFEYYINFIPWIAVLLSPLFIFIAVIFFTSRMAAQSEIVAILASGVSFYRMLVPYFIAATILAGFLYYANHWLVPIANKERIQFENTYINIYRRTSERNVHRQIDPGVFIYIETFNMKDSIGYKFSLEQVEDGELVKKIMAENIKWDGSTGSWRINKYLKRVYIEDGEIVTTGEAMDTMLNIHPTDFEEKINYKEALTTPELNKLIEQEKRRGATGIEFYEVEKHRRSADTFTTFILTLIGVSMASRKVRGGLGLHIVIGLLIAAGYIIFTRFTSTFSTNGNLHPFFGAWMANIIFGVVAIVLMFRAPK